MRIDPMTLRTLARIYHRRATQAVSDDVKLSRYEAASNVVFSIFQQFTGLWIRLFKRFFGIHGCYTLISNNVTGLFAEKAVSGDIATYLQLWYNILVQQLWYNILNNKHSEPNESKTTVRLKATT